jgi:uncharacterized protein YggE
MKKKLFVLFTPLMIAALIAGCSPLSTSSANQSIKTLDVTGTGLIELKPDIARVNIGVRSESPDVAEALRMNNESIAAVIQILKEQGVDGKDIQTRNFYIYQQQTPRPMSDEPDKPSQTYVVENTVAITVRELDSLGEILTSVVAKGANTINGITFDVDDRETALAEARKKAIADAKAKAQAIADAAGIKLGQIRSISINENGGIIMPRAEMAQDMGMGGGAVPISEGTLSIRVTANLTFDMD